MGRPDTTGEQPALGFLQLCADRRYHRKTMEAFQAATGLPVDGYWIEAGAGGSPAFDGPTPTGQYAYAQGARVMGWAAHGDGCGGFPGRSDEEMAAALRSAGARRVRDFPEAEHWLLLGIGGEVEVIRASAEIV